MKKRVFLIVLDSAGVGELPDAREYGDEGSNTLKHVSEYPGFAMPNMEKLGLFSILHTGFKRPDREPVGSYGRMAEISKGKDTMTGHWEMAGIISKQKLPTYPDGFPNEIIEAFEMRTGRKVLCNLPYSGTGAIVDYGKEQQETGGLIVYTSADSVFQVCAHEEIIPVETLYEYCEAAREILTGEHGVGRVIARPFVGEYPDYVRTPRRHDYPLIPPQENMLSSIRAAGQEVLTVGKIVDIFAGQGITEFVRSESNADGMEKMLAYMERDFEGLCFVNLVDFDTEYGHRNDVAGYANALAEFDRYIPSVLERMQEEDILIITADHGCDPTTESTDHSREYVPVVLYGAKIKENYDVGTRKTFADIGATVLEYLSVPVTYMEGTSMWQEIRKTK